MQDDEIGQFLDAAAFVFDADLVRPLVGIERTRWQIHRLLPDQVGDILDTEPIKAQGFCLDQHAVLVCRKAADVDHRDFQHCQQAVAVMFRQRLQFRLRQVCVNRNADHRRGAAEFVDQRVLGVVRKIGDTVDRRIDVVDELLQILIFLHFQHHGAEVVACLATAFLQKTDTVGCVLEPVADAFLDLRSISARIVDRDLYLVQLDLGKGFLVQPRQRGNAEQQDDEHQDICDRRMRRKITNHRSAPSARRRRLSSIAGADRTSSGIPSITGVRSVTMMRSSTSIPPRTTTRSPWTS